MSANALRQLQISPQPAARLEPDHFRPARLARIDQSVGEPHRGSIEAILLRPELRPLSRGLTILVDQSLEVPFRVDPDAVLRLDPDFLAAPAAAAVLLRHAFELAITAPLTDGLDDPVQLAAAWLAARTAGLYLEGLTLGERTIALDHIASSLHRSYRLLAQPAESLLPAPCQDDLTELAGLAALQKELPDAVAKPTEPTLSRAWDLFRQAAPIAAPAEQLLISGGDPRVRVDPETGVNSYGSSPAPSPAALSFSSSTASTISEQSFAAVERLRQSLIEHALYDDPEAILGAEANRLRQEIAAACGVGALPGLEIILTASGTDAEYHALYLAGSAAGYGGGLLNVVVAPDETGSGVPLAAAGLHFAAETAQGVAVVKGEPIAGLGAGRIQTASVAIRTRDGVPRSLAEIDQELQRLVALGVLGGMKILVHLLDSSKTGIGAPSLDAVLRLRERYPEDLEVVVDACQMRGCARALAGYLARGFMVMVTGSKFFTGPPFAGALLVPPQLAAKAGRLGAFPEGLRAYCGSSDLPDGWPLAGPALAGRANPGPLFRWQAALWERQAFEAVPRQLRDECLDRLGEWVGGAIDTSEWLQAVAAPLFDRQRLLPDGGWHDRQSIFPFTVLRQPAAGAATPLTMSEARALHRWLMEDLNERITPVACEAKLSADDRAVLAKAYHLGQPVKVPQPDQADSGALRLCLSARLVSRVALDPLYAPSLDGRFERAAREIRAVVRKAELAARNFDRLTVPPSDPD